MPEAFSSLDGWLLRTTVSGGVVLLIGTLWMLLTKQPVQRQRIGEFALLAALLVALPAALPSWWSIPGTSPNSPTNKVLFGSDTTFDSRFKLQEVTDQRLLANNDIHFDDDVEFAQFEALLSELFFNVEQLERTSIVELPEKTTEYNCTKGSISPVSFTWLQWTLRGIGLAYLGLVVALLIRCSMGYYGLWRYWRQRRPAPAHVHLALAELEPDPSHRPRIGVNALVHGPVSYGLWKPTILLPPHFCNEGDPEKLRWILAHELTHLRRRDAWGCLLLALGGALYFHVPWFWWMKRHVRLAQEYLADAAAVRIANAVEYAQYLVSLTTLTSRPTLASSQAAGVFESPSDLYRRVNMLLNQRSILERGAPRWWTFTAAASFLALAACTAGIKLYADEPAKKEGISFVIVADDDDKKPADKKSAEKKAFTLKAQGDGKGFYWTTDDGKGQPNVLSLQGVLSGDKQKQIDEAIKKLEQVLEKLPRQVDGETRAKLEDLKKTLKSLKDNNNIVWQRAAEAAKDGEARARVRLLEAAKQGEDMKKQVEWKLLEARKQAEVQRDHAVVAEKLARAAQEQSTANRDRAMAAEKLAKAAQEKALRSWKEAKDGDGRDEAIKALEKAISDKERALRDLKSGDKASADAGPLRARLFDSTTKAAPATSKGRLGVVVADIDSNLRGHLDVAAGSGLMIQEVVDNSPAWNNGNGLRSSDILLEIDGKKVPANQDQFREMVSKLSDGTHSAVVLRKGKKQTIGGIKLPPAEKSGKVVVDSPAGLHLNVIPKVVAADLALANNLKAIEALDLKVHSNPVHAKVAGELVTLTPTVRAGELKLAADVLKGAGELHLAADVLKAHPGIAHFELAQPIQGVVVNPAIRDVKVVPLLAMDMQGAQVGSKPRLGVTLEEVPEVVASQIELPEDRGLFVRDVSEGSAAQKGGILKNDILIEFADKPVSRDHAAFTQFVKTLKPGKYTATVVRKGKEIRIRDINIADAKVIDEEKKARAKDWIVEGDGKGDKEEAKEAAKNKAKDAFKKPKDDFFPNANRGLNFARNKGNTSMTINNDQFTAVKSDEGKTITVTGKMVAGKAQASSIAIKTDDGEKKYKTVKDVPEEDRAEVEKILGSFKGNVFQWNNGGNAFKWNGADQFNNGQFNKQLEEQMKIFERSMKQLGEGNPGFEQMEKQLEQLREQLKKMRGGKDDDEK